MSSQPLQWTYRTHIYIYIYEYTYIVYIYTRIYIWHVVVHTKKLLVRHEWSHTCAVEFTLFYCIVWWLQLSLVWIPSIALLASSEYFAAFSNTHELHVFFSLTSTCWFWQGLLPEALLKTYRFYQHEPQSYHTNCKSGLTPQSMQKHALSSMIQGGI